MWAHCTQQLVELCNEHTIVFKKIVRVTKYTLIKIWKFVIFFLLRVNGCTKNCLLDVVGLSKSPTASAAHKTFKSVLLDIIFKIIFTTSVLLQKLTKKSNFKIWRHAVITSSMVIQCVAVSPQSPSTHAVKTHSVARALRSF